MEQNNKTTLTVGEETLQCDAVIGIGIVEEEDTVNVDIRILGGASLTSLGIAIGRLLAQVENNIGSEDMKQVLQVAHLINAQELKENNSGKSNS